MASEFPHRQWLTCPACRSRDTLRTEIRDEIRLYVCQACHHKWLARRVSPPPPIPADHPSATAAVFAENAPALSVTVDQKPACPHCGDSAGVEFDVEVGRYRCMRPGCRYKVAIERRDLERRLVNIGPPAGLSERRSGNDRRRIGATGHNA